MPTCASERSLRRLFLASLGLLVLAAFVFYERQNGAGAVGGGIALPKLLWLASAILFWFVLPVLFLLDRRLRGTHLAYGIFLGNMLLRAGVELWMMYLSHNWHPYYGIGHDLFSLALCLWLARRIPPTALLARLQRGFFLVAAAMFLVETFFAGYLVIYLYGTDPIYFVADDGAHAPVLRLTWAVVFLLSAYLLGLVKGWLYAPAAR